MYLTQKSARLWFIKSCLDRTIARAFVFIPKNAEKRGAPNTAFPIFMQFSANVVLSLNPPFVQVNITVIKTLITPTSNMEHSPPVAANRLIRALVQSNADLVVKYVSFRVVHEDVTRERI